MKIRHKIISMITAIIFLAGMFSVIPLTAVAYGTYGSLTYNTYDSDGDGVYDYLTIASCAQPVTEVEIAGNRRRSRYGNSAIRIRRL